MRIKETKLYRISELSDEAKEHAHEEWLNDGDDHYAWGSENEASLKAFESIFPIKSKNWSYGDRPEISYSTNIDNDVEELTGVRLLKYVVNNYWHNIFQPKYLRTVKGKTIRSRIQFENSCVLTGYCIDDDILQPIYDFLKKPGKHVTLEDLLSDCLESWVQACQRDYEGSQTLEAFLDTADCNEWEFEEDGSWA